MPVANITIPFPAIISLSDSLQRTKNTFFLHVYIFFRTFAPDFIEYT